LQRIVSLIPKALLQILPDISSKAINHCYEIQIIKEKTSFQPLKRVRDEIVGTQRISKFKVWMISPMM